MLVRRGETSGAEPLSKHLAKSNLSFQYHAAGQGANSSLEDTTSAAFMVVKGERPTYEQLDQIQNDSTVRVTSRVSDRDTRDPNNQ